MKRLITNRSIENSAFHTHTDKCVHTQTQLKHHAVAWLFPYFLNWISMLILITIIIINLNAMLNVSMAVRILAIVFTFMFDGLLPNVRRHRIKSFQSVKRKTNVWAHARRKKKGGKRTLIVVLLMSIHEAIRVTNGGAKRMTGKWNRFVTRIPTQTSYTHTHTHVVHGQE